MKSKKKERYKQSAFLLNVKDMFIDTATYTPQELGIYIQLLLLQWANKEIDSDPERLGQAVARGLPQNQRDVERDVARDVARYVDTFIDANIENETLRVTLRSKTAHFARDVARDVSRQAYVVKSFLHSWDHISKKYIPAPSGGFLNPRLEEEREAVSQFADNQSSRTKAATDARLLKSAQAKMARGEEWKLSEREKFLVTCTNTNSNYSTITNTGANGENPLPLKDKGDQDHSFAPREFCLQRGKSSPLRLYLAVNGSFTCREIESLLTLNLESLAMHQEIWRLPDDYQCLIFQSYFTEKIAESDDYTSGKLRKDFLWWYTNSMQKLERKFNDLKRDEQWFRDQLAVSNGACKDEKVKQEFVDYYLNRMPSGKFYFQTLNNFSVLDSLKKWVKQDFKTVQKIKETSTVAVIPRDGQSIEDLKKHYKGD